MSRSEHASALGTRAAITQPRGCTGPVVPRPGETIVSAAPSLLWQFLSSPGQLVLGRAVRPHHEIDTGGWNSGHVKVN